MKLLLSKIFIAMLYFLVVVFVIGYLFIVLEHNISVDKSATALLTGALCWTLVSQILPDTHLVNEQLYHHLSEIAGILFFLMGAMTIVELIDAYDGFEIITSKIKTKNQVKLLWVICLMTFFLSAILDNLTTAIVMVTLIKKIVKKDELRLYFVGMIIIAANAGGAWSPMGDVTTTMLWIGGQITALNIMKQLFLPSIISLIIPLVAISFSIKGTLEDFDEMATDETKTHTYLQKSIVFFVGIGGLVSVLVFKTLTHLPPFMGMILALGVLWLVTEIIIKNKDEEFKQNYSVYKALQRLDMPSVLFFLGILLSVAALQTVGVLTDLAGWLNETVKNQTVIVTIIGLFSAIVDNVPLVAAAMGMYSLEVFPPDNHFWELLAFCAGTGGSVLIIGSAAGVAAMGMEKISFFWYIKKISWLALLGYFAGIGVFLLLF